MKFENGTITFKNGSYSEAMREARDVRRSNKDKMMQEMGSGAIYGGQQWTLLALEEMGRTEEEVMEFYDKAPTKKEVLATLQQAIEENPTLNKITISTFNNCYVYLDHEAFVNGNDDPWEAAGEEDTDIVVWERDQGKQTMTYEEMEQASLKAELAEAERTVEQIKEKLNELLSN